MNQKTQEAIRLIKDNCCIFCGTPTNEDLRKWFGKGGAGGAGGGGIGGSPAPIGNVTATPGIANTGGGGGGGQFSPNEKGGNGGTGLLLIAYPT